MAGQIVTSHTVFQGHEQRVDVLETFELSLVDFLNHPPVNMQKTHRHLVNGLIRNWFVSYTGWGESPCAPALEGRWTVLEVGGGGGSPNTKQMHGNSSLTLYNNDAVSVAEIAMFYRTLLHLLQWPDGRGTKGWHLWIWWWTLQIWIKTDTPWPIK